MHPLIKKARQEGRSILETEALHLLKHCHIPAPDYRFAQRKEVIDACHAVGWSILMKVVSQDILHKKDEGGVILDLKTNRQLKTFSQQTSLEKKGRRVEGILICPFQSHEVELSAGRVRDPQFGPVITFGLGGIWIEVLRDISYGIAPLSLQETEEMISSIRGHSVLEGKRGKKPAYCHTLGDLLARLSEIVVAEEAIREIDLNPLFPLEKGAFIADLCMIVLGKGSRQKDEECCQL